MLLSPVGPKFSKGAIDTLFCTVHHCDVLLLLDSLILQVLSEKESIHNFTYPMQAMCSWKTATWKL
jgi:hypothetical protein